MIGVILPKKQLKLMKRFNISLDVEQDLHSSKFSGVDKGLLIFEKIMDKHNIKPTLFVTGKALEHNPGLFKRLKKKGWEIGFHSYNHDKFDNLTPYEKNKDIKEGVKLFKKIFGHSPRGFRAPQHMINNETVEILRVNGFQYDSSYAPLNFFQFLFFPGKLRTNMTNFISNINPSYKNGIKEIPTSSLLVPFVTFSIRILPITAIKFLILVMYKRKLILFYGHSWDFIKLEKSLIYKLCNLNKFLIKLEKILIFMDRKRQFIRLEEYKI